MGLRREPGTVNPILVHLHHSSIPENERVSAQVNYKSAYAVPGQCAASVLIHLSATDSMPITVTGATPPNTWDPCQFAGQVVTCTVGRLLPSYADWQHLYNQNG